VADLTAALDKARKAGAEVILTYTVGPELAVIANGRARLGWKAPIIGSWPLSWANFLNVAKGNAEGASMPQTFIEEPVNSRRTEFIVTYLGKNNLKRISSAVSAAQGYDTMLLLAAAIRQAGSTAGPKIRAALENLEDRVPGVVTTYERPFTAQDHEAITDNMVVMGEVRKRPGAVRPQGRRKGCHRRAQAAGRRDAEGGEHHRQRVSPYPPASQRPARGLAFFMALRITTIAHHG
jgi:branched-chain amino acid transport system substrate-binding protein